MHASILVLCLVAQWPTSANLTDVGSVADPTGYLRATGLNLGPLPADYRSAGFPAGFMLRSAELTHASGRKYILVVRDGNGTTPSNSQVTVWAYDKPGPSGFSTGRPVYCWDPSLPANVRSPLDLKFGIHMLLSPPADCRWTLR